MNRTFAAFLIGAIAAFYITVLAIGYAHFGMLPRLATFVPAGPTLMVARSVTAEGRAAGLRDGDVVDRTRLSLADREVFATHTGIAGARYSFVVQRGAQSPRISFTLAAATNRTVRDVVDISLRVFMMLTALLLIARGRDDLSWYAGLWFAGWAIASGFSLTFDALGAQGSLIASFGGLLLLMIFVYARFMFGYRLLAARVGRAARSAFVGLLALGLAGLVATIVWRFFQYAYGWQDPALARTLNGWSQLELGTLFVAVMATAAFAAEREKAQSIRILFWSAFIAQISGWANQGFVLAGQDAPLLGALALLYIVPAVTVPYVLFTRRLAAVDFYVSKAAIYAIVLSVVVGVFVLLESLVERLALGRTESIILQLIVPLALGLSLKRIEHGVEGFVERVLYRDKLSAAEQLNALIDDFPHMHAPGVLMRRVVEDVHDLMRCPSAVLYRLEDGNYLPVAESDAGSLHAPIPLDDPAFVRLRSAHRPIETTQFRTALPGDGVLVPLIVFGSITGALYCRYRESREHYDPDEIALLSRLSHELAVAIVWMEGDKESELSARR